MEERQPLVQPTPSAGGGTWGMPKASESQYLTLKGILCMFAIAFVLFVLSASLSRTITEEDIDTKLIVSPDMVNEGEQSMEINSGLINPYNGTKPARTTTSDCISDMSLPVVAGADVVAYFSMEAGTKPAIATGDISTTYDDYLFFFNTHENRQTFEVCEGSVCML